MTYRGSRFFLAGVAVSGLLLSGCAGEVPTGDETSGPAISVDYLSGVDQVEDIIQIPGSPWVIASSVPVDLASFGGGIYGIDSTDDTVEFLWPGDDPQSKWDRTTYADCPGSPPLDTVATHGINIREGADGLHTLYVINHGREAVEVFELDDSQDAPLITWIGCVPTQPDVRANGIAPIRTTPHDFVLTNIVDPNAGPDIFDKMFEGEVTGDVRVWASVSGWSTVPNSGLSAPNGIETSEDGRTAYVAEWTGRRVVALSLSGVGEKTAAPVSFLPDNLRWSETGSLLTTGQDITEFATLNCGAEVDCPTGYSVVEIEPDTMEPDTMQVSLLFTDSSDFALATVAAPVGDEIWVGSLKGDRIARISNALG